MKAPFRSNTSKIILATSVAALLGGAFASAANLTWNSAGPSDNWSTAAGNGNWLPGGVLWTNNDSAIFDITSGTAESINVTVANTVFDNMTFDVTGFTIGSGGAGSLLLGNDLASTITVTNAADTATVNETLGNNAGGASSLTKAGAGTLVLFGTAANTYSGGTTISAGIVTLNHEGALGTGAVTNDGTLNLNKVGTNLVYTGLSTAMSGAGVTNVTVGTGTVTTVLNGDYSGYTGTWNIGVGAAAGAGKVQLQGLDNAAATINVSANATVFVGAAVTRNASIVLGGGDTGEALGQLRVEGGGIWAGSITLAGAMTGADGFIGANTNSTGTFSGVIGETGGARVLTKSGAGTSILSGLNTYSGGTTVHNGILSVSVLNNTGVAGNVGTGSTISLGNGGTGAQFIYTGAGETTDRVINLAGTTGGAVLTQSGLSGHLKVTGAMTATGAGAKTLTLQGSTAGTAELAGAIVNSTLATAITKTGTGTWTLSGANTNTGATTVSLGTLRLNFDTGAGGTDSNKLADAGALTLGSAAGSATLELVGGSHTEIVASTTLTAGTSSFVNRTGGTAVLQMGAITPNAATSLVFNGSGIATTTNANHASGILGTWARVGTAWATSSGGSIVAYTGYTDVSQFLDGTPAGTIPTGATNNVRIINGGATGNVTLGGGALTQAYTLQNDSTGATIEFASGTDVLNIGDDAGGAILLPSGAGALVIGATPGNGVLTSGATANTVGANLRFINDSTSSVTVNSKIANNGTDVVGITKSGNGTLVLAGDNSFTGVTTVGSGSATAGGGGTLVLSGTNTSTGNTNVGNGATLQLQSAGALANSGVTNSLLQLFNGSTLQLRADAATTFNGTNGIGALNNATTTIDVNQLTGAGLNNTLTISSGITSVGNAVTINVTGGNGYALSLGTLQSVTGTGTNLVLNPTTANVTLGGYRNQNNGTNSSTLTLSGTTTGNTVTGVIADQGAGSTGTTGKVAVTKTGTGSWDLQGANTQTGNMIVREGTLTLSGNRTAAGGIIVVGDTAGLNGTLNITNGAWSMGTNNIRVANQVNTSSVNQTGGAISFTGGDMVLVGAVGGTGTYDLSAGSITGPASGNRGVLVGINTNSTGTFNLSGTGNIAMGTAMLQLARSDSAVTGATGTFNQTGGTALFGTLTIGGGVGATFANNSGTLNLTGGTFQANAFTLLSAGDANTAVINIGGTVLATLPAFPTARGVGSTATLTLDGGTLRPTASSATYIGGLTNAFIKTNGANIDTNNFSITVSQPLLEDAVDIGGGLTKSGVGNLTLTGANLYTGTTSVTGGALTLGAGGSVNASAAVNISSGGKFVQANATTAVTPGVALNSGTVDGIGTIDSLTVADLAGNVLTNGNGSTGALTLGSLTFGGDATVNVNSAGTAAFTVTGALATTPANGQVTINVPVAPVWSNNTTYNLIGYGSWAGAITDFTQGTVAGLGARQSAAIGTTGASNGFITLTVSGDSVEWTGVSSGIWSTTPILTPYNWKLEIAGTDAEFITNDSVVFNDNATGTTTVEINDATVAPASVLFNNSSKNYTVNGTNGITSGFVIKSGTGSVTMNTANTYTGGTTVNAGTLNIGNASALGAAASTLTLNGGAIDNTTGAALTTNNHPLVINGDFAFTGSNPLSLGNGAANLGSAAGTARAITVNASTLTLGGIISNGATANGITKAGNGTLILSAANTYTGTTTINAGTVIVQNAAALGTNAGGTTVAGTGTLDVNSLNLGTEVITISGSGFGNAGTIVNNGAADQINALGRLVLAGDATIGGSKRWDLRNSAPTLDMGGFTLTKVGINQISLVGVTVSNPGNITINGGIFGVETTTNLGGSAANAINVNEFATLNLYGNTIPVAWTINLADGTLSQNNTNATVSGPVTLTGANTIGGTGAATTNLTLAGVISGAGGFTKTGLVQLNVSGDNTYDGPTTITAGRVVVSHANALGSAVGATSVANNAILQVAGGVTTNSGENVTLAGGGDTFGALQGGTGGGTWAGEVTLGDAAVRIGATTGNTLTITGTIADGVGTGFHVSGQTGTGVVVINPTTTNTYTGLTGIIRGTLRIGKNDALPTGTTLDVDSFASVSEPVAFDLGGYNQTVGALQDTATTDANLGSTVTNSVAATTSTLTVNGSTSTIFNGVIQNGVGTVALSKDGSGTLQLAGASTFTGATAVSGGTLLVSGSISGSAVTVSGTGTLGGTGTVGALTALSGGTIAPGASPGILNSGALSMATGSTLSIEINGTTLGTGYDQLSVTGGVDITGATLTLGGTFNAGATNDLFTIMLNDGAGDAVTGTFAGLAEGAHAFSVSGQEFAISYVGGDGNDIVLTAVPEPGSAMLLLGGLAVLGARRRRRA